MRLSSIVKQWNCYEDGKSIGGFYLCSKWHSISSHVNFEKVSLIVTSSNSLSHFLEGGRKINVTKFEVCMPKFKTHSHSAVYINILSKHMHL